MSKEHNNPQPAIAEEDEIDLISLIKTLWKSRRTVIKTTLIFMAIGIFIAIFSSKEYKASITIVPQTGGNVKIGGNLSGLAAMAGINLGSSSNDSEIPATLYPQIINSVSFQLELLQTPLTIKGQDKPITYEDYYTNVYSPSILEYLIKYTIGLKGIIIKAIKGKSKIQNPKAKNIIEITYDEKELLEELTDQVTIDIQKKEGYVNISVNMPEALAAAQLTQKAQELLQQYVISFKIKKSRAKLEFIKDRYHEKENEFKKAQQQLAHFRDTNQNLSSALSQTTLQSLQSEYDLIFNVYSELAKQLETQQIQVKEDTPVFTVIKPVLIPLEKSKPKRLMIVFISIVLGGIISIGLVFLKILTNDFLVKLKK